MSRSYSGDSIFDSYSSTKVSPFPLILSSSIGAGPRISLPLQAILPRSLPLAMSQRPGIRAAALLTLSSAPRAPPHCSSPKRDCNYCSWSPIPRSADSPNRPDPAQSPASGRPNRSALSLTRRSSAASATPASQTHSHLLPPPSSAAVHVPQCITMAISRRPARCNRATHFPVTLLPHSLTLSRSVAGSVIPSPKCRLNSPPQSANNCHHPVPESTHTPQAGPRSDLVLPDYAILFTYPVPLLMAANGSQCPSSATVSPYQTQCISLSLPRSRDRFPQSYLSSQSPRSGSSHSQVACS